MRQKEGGLDRSSVVINSEFLGSGSNELGSKLMGSFFRKIWASAQKPDRIIFYNSGVKLLAQGSPVLDAMEALANAGVDLIACGTCVAFFGLQDKLAFGRVSTMEEIASIITGSAGTVTV